MVNVVGDIMTATGKFEGKDIYFDEEDRLWRYKDNKESVFKDWAEKPCPECKCGVCNREVEGVIVLLKDGSPALKFVDKCIGGLIRELNQHGIRTTSSSCCGHGKNDGEFFIPKEFVKKDKWGYKIRIPKRHVGDTNDDEPKLPKIPPLGATEYA